MTDNENKPAAVAPCKHPDCNCAWVSGQGLVCEAEPKASAVPEAPKLAVELAGVAETLKEGDGFWRSCSGCYDTEDGHPTHRYAYSEVLGCPLGNGCRECGGLGAVWDNTDYDAMLADDEEAAPQAEEAPAAPNAQIKHLTHERDLARRAATEACARAEKAEAQLAAIRAGVEGLHQYLKYERPGIPPLVLIERDETLALFGQQPAPACDICAGTKTAFGKRCECLEGVSA